jgi:glycine/D-amino acid oxidase-like deaminating enzyme
MTSAYDAVTVGSGFGGAITACRLAEPGRCVCETIAALAGRGAEHLATQARP